jgi:hypothetical protein
LISGKYTDATGNTIFLPQNKIFISQTGTINNKQETIYSFVDQSNNKDLGNVTYNPTLNTYTSTNSISNTINYQNTNIIMNAGFAHNQFDRISGLLPENYNVTMNSLYALNTYPFNKLMNNQPYQ